MSYSKLKIIPSLSINTLIKEGDIEALTEALNALSPFELADLIASKSEEDQSVLFRALSPSICSTNIRFSAYLYTKSTLAQNAYYASSGFIKSSFS